MRKNHAQREPTERLRTPIILMLLMLPPTQAYTQENNPLEYIGDRTEEFFTACFLRQGRAANQCLSASYTDCMAYVQGYARNDLPCINNTRISAISIVEEEIVRIYNETEQSIFQRAIESGYEFCGELFEFRRGENSGSQIDHCLFSATEIAFQFLDDEIRGLE